MKSLQLILFLLYITLESSLSQSTSQTNCMKEPGPRPDLNGKRIVCYYSSWAKNREEKSAFFETDIDPNLCTHVLYAYAVLEEDGSIAPFDPNGDLELNGYANFVDLKQCNPHLRVILSIGGGKQGPVKFSLIAANPALRKVFAKSAVAFLQQYNFDGLDIVWKYPLNHGGAAPSDKENYVLLVKEMREEFDKVDQELDLSIAAPHLESVIKEGFDMPELAKYLTFMSILTYNYHVSTDYLVNHIAPLYPYKEDQFSDQNIDTTVNVYKKLGVDLQIFNLAIPMYAVAFKLENPAENTIGSTSLDEASLGTEKGAILYNSLCRRINNESWNVVHVNKTAVGPYAYKDDIWVAYDDADMIRNKARYVAENGLGGLTFWSVDMDDFRGLCGSKLFPLINAAKEVFQTEIDPSSQISRQTTPKPIRLSTIPPTTQTMPPTTSKSIPQTIPPTVSRPPKKISRVEPNVIDTPKTQKSSNSNFEEALTLISNARESSNDETSSTPPSTFSSVLFPNIPGAKNFNSQRDIIFQNINIEINHYHRKD